MLLERIQKKDKDLVFIYTTCASREEAKSITLMAVNDRLAVCADFWAIESIYPWQGVIQEVEQYMLVLTTQKILSEKLIRAIELVHSYTVPVVAECDIQIASGAYRFWADQTLGNTTELLSEEEAQAKKKFDEEGGYHPGHLK